MDHLLHNKILAVPLCNGHCFLFALEKWDLRSRGPWPLLHSSLLTLRHHWRCYIRASVSCVLSIKSHFSWPFSLMEVGKCFFFFLFLRGCPQKAPGLQTQSEPMSHVAAETQYWEFLDWVLILWEGLCQFSASWRFPGLLSVSVNSFRSAGRHPDRHQTSGRAMVWSKAGGKSWDLSYTVYRGELLSYSFFFCCLTFPVISSNHTET